MIKHMIKQTTIAMTKPGRFALAGAALLLGAGALWANPQTSYGQSAPLNAALPKPGAIIEGDDARLSPGTYPGQLVGLRGVLPIVSAPSMEAVKLGVTREQLKSSVETILRRNHVPILTVPETKATVGRPILLVQTTMDKGAVHVDVNLHEMVRLERDPSIAVMSASIWNCNRTNTHIVSARDVVKTAIVEVEVFAADYQKAHSR